MLLALRHRVNWFRKSALSFVLGAALLLSACGQVILPNQVSSSSSVHGSHSVLFLNWKAIGGAGETDFTMALLNSSTQFQIQVTRYNGVDMNHTFILSYSDSHELFNFLTNVFNRQVPMVNSTTPLLSGNTLITLFDDLDQGSSVSNPVFNGSSGANLFDTFFADVAARV